MQMKIYNTIKSLNGNTCSTIQTEFNTILMENKYSQIIYSNANENNQIFHFLTCHMF